MIPFFRRIRKKMADDNKPLKYARYAIGEIVLVVIGILIALSINNWNEQNKRNKEEQLMLKDLKIELTANKIEIERIIDSHQKALNDALKLNYLMDHPEKVSDVSVDSILTWTYFLHGQIFKPEKGILNSIISSGQINLIKNKEIKYFISSLNDFVIQKIELSRSVHETGTNYLLASIYPGAIRRSLQNVEYNYNTGISKHINWKNMLVIPEFFTSLKLFIGVRKVAIKNEMIIKKRYEDIISLIDTELSYDSIF